MMDFILNHLYVDPSCQSQGIGSEGLRQLLAQADVEQLPIRLGALRDSVANRFYQRHGFEQIGEEEWDNYYIRWPRANSSSRITRTIQIGGLTKQELPARLNDAGVQLNDSARGPPR